MDDGTKKIMINMLSDYQATLNSIKAKMTGHDGAIKDGLDTYINNQLINVDNCIDSVSRMTESKQKPLTFKTPIGRKNRI